MRRTLLTGALLTMAALATAGPAHAKGHISAVLMCGPADCGPPSAPGPMRALSEQFFAAAGGMAPNGTPPLGVYYRMRFEPAHEVPDAPAFYVPGTGSICAGQVCVPAGPRVRAALDAAATGVSGYRPHIRSVTIDDAPAADPGGYARLFDDLKTAPAEWGGRAVTIDVRLTADSPWSASGFSLMTYYPRDHLLSRNGEWVRADPALDRRIRGDAGAPAAAHAGGSGIPRAAFVIAAAAVAGAAALALAVRRSASRRPRAA